MSMEGCRRDNSGQLSCPEETRESALWTAKEHRVWPHTPGLDWGTFAWKESRGERPDCSLELEEHETFGAREGSGRKGEAFDPDSRYAADHSGHPGRAGAGRDGQQFTPGNCCLEPPMCAISDDSDEPPWIPGRIFQTEFACLTPLVDDKAIPSVHISIEIEQQRDLVKLRAGGIVSTSG